MIETMRRLGLGVATAALALGMGAAQAQVKTSFGPTTTDISTGHAGHSSLPAVLGYWKEEGIDVNVFGMNGGAAGLQLLTAGNVDFLSITGEELLVARSKGTPVKAVYMHARTPISRIAVPKSLGVTSLKDLKGKTLGTPIMQPNQFAVAAFAEVGVNYTKDLKVVATGVGAPALLALQRGDIAGWLSWDTAVATLENRGMEFVVFKPSYYGELFGNVVATREEMIAKNPELVVKLARGISKAVHFGLQNPEAAIKIHWKAYPQSKPQGTSEEELLKDAKRIFQSRFDSYKLEGTNKYGESFPAQWKRVADQLVEQEMLPKGFDASGVYTNQFVDEINKWDRAAVEKQAAGWKD